MSLLIIGSVAFDAIETPFGKTDKIVGGAATYASLSASYFCNNVKIVAVVGEDFHQEDIEEFISSVSLYGTKTKMVLSTLLPYESVFSRIIWAPYRKRNQFFTNQNNGKMN